mgnify:FL=1
MTRTVRIPFLFWDDCQERELEMPPAIKETKRHVWIDRDHPAVDELLSCASYYSECESSFLPEYRHQCRSARATIRAIVEFDED